MWLNRSKRSVVLDLKSDAGRAAMSALIASADVFVQNLAPGAAEASVSVPRSFVRRTRS